ncbi:MAG: glycosyltransferase family 9 protein, partial [Muribaculum sp.]|nr:glycosyltransferase family 9 protein [Muribaculum sp.]
MNIDTTQQQTVIVYRPSALGDVAMAIPAIYTLAMSHPDVRVVAVTNRKFTSLFIDRPANLEVFGIDKNDFKNLPSVLKLVKRLDEYDPSVFIDLHNTLRSWIIDTEFARRGRRVEILDKRRHERLSILRHHAVSKRDFTQRYFDAIEMAGYSLDRSLFKGFADKAAKQTAVGKRRVGIAPFARYATKTYPVEMMEEVVATLSASGHYEIYLFGGGEQELAILNSWNDRYSAIVFVSGSLTLDREMALMGTMDVMVTMDSANMHLASLEGTRVISIWGGTTPACGFM